MASAPPRSDPGLAPGHGQRPRGGGPGAASRTNGVHYRSAMPIEHVVAIIAAAVGAGAINAVIGSGTLITFPTLLMLGYPPIVANISNNVGLLPGGLAGAYGYRREIAKQKPLLKQLAPASLAGGLTGALLLLLLPSAVFDAVVPALVALGLVLVIFGPRLQKAAARHHSDDPGRGHRILAPAATFAAGIYGGYFGAAQGVILVGLLSVLVPVALQEINGAKNVLVPLVNAIAAVVFLTLRWGAVDWLVVLLIGVGSFAGGLIGSSVGRRLPTPVLRAVIVVVGSLALVKLLAG